MTATALSQVNARRRSSGSGNAQVKEYFVKGMIEKENFTNNPPSFLNSVGETQLVQQDERARLKRFPQLQQEEAERD
jgi:hypothetical protein